MDSEPNPPIRNWATMSEAGSLLVGPSLIGIFIDVTSGSSPWGTIGGIALGSVASMAYLVRLMNRANNSDSQDRFAK